MNNIIRIYSKEEQGYKNLEIARDLLKEYTNNLCDFEIVDGVFDGGNNWNWTSISCRGKNVISHWVFCPRDYEYIVTGENISGICKEIAKGLLLDEILKGVFFTWNTKKEIKEKAGEYSYRTIRAIYDEIAKDKNN